MGEEQKSVQEPDINQLRKVRREKLADLQSNGKNPFEITKFDVTCHAMDIKEHYEEMEGKQVTLAGRIMQKRVMGKASFCNVLSAISQVSSPNLSSSHIISKADPSGPSPSFFPTTEAPDIR